MVKYVLNLDLWQENPHKQKHLVKERWKQTKDFKAYFSSKIIKFQNHQNNFCPFDFI